MVPLPPIGQMAVPMEAFALGNLLVFALAGIALYVFYRRLKTRTAGVRVDDVTPVWASFAMVRGMDFQPSESSPRIRGNVGNIELSVRAEIHRSGLSANGRSRGYGTTRVRAVHRAALPPGMVISQRITGRTGAASLEKYGGDKLQLTGATPADLTAHFNHPPFVRALNELWADDVNAALTSRAVELEVDSIIVSDASLSKFVDRVLALAQAVQTVSPQSEQRRAPAPITARNKRLGQALDQLEVPGMSSGDRLIILENLRMRPLDCEFRILSVTEAGPRRDLPEGVLVSGFLISGPGRVELTIPSPLRDTLPELQEGFTLRCEGTLEGFDEERSLLEIVATTPPETSTREVTG